MYSFSAIAVSPQASSSIATASLRKRFPAIVFPSHATPLTIDQGSRASASSSSHHSRTPQAFASKRFATIRLPRPCSMFTPPRSAP